MAVDPRLDAWLSVLHDQNGTDILLTDGSKPLLRVGGRLGTLEESDPLTGEEIEVIARTQLRDRYGDRLHLGQEVDFSFSWRDRARIRANAFYQRGSCTLSLRRIPVDIPSFAELGAPEALRRAVAAPSGLILVTGPAGSGKSTTMAAMVDAVNRTRACHIVTIEDPIEHLHRNRVAAVSQREVGADTESFSTALRSVQREDPDVVLVGEVRDPESMAAALTLAETGHLVITSLHTNYSTQAVERVIDAFPDELRNQARVQLAASLVAVVYQRLVPGTGGGQVAAFELMLGMPAVRDLIREDRVEGLRHLVASGRGAGMQTLEQHLGHLVAAGTVDPDVAVDVSSYPEEIPLQLAEAVAGR